MWIVRAGAPPASARAETFPETMGLAAMRQPVPMTLPAVTVICAASQVFAPITTGAEVCLPWQKDASTRVCSEDTTRQHGPNITSSPFSI